MVHSTTLPYLNGDAVVDIDDAAVRAVAESLAGVIDEDVARAAFTFVRDEIAHSWDAQHRIVTVSASDALRERTGMCYSKSHLLAALLRARGIPAGFSYQRLTILDDPEDGFCIHALNTIYLDAHHRWIRVDARGNKPGVDAQFSIERERLAFAVRPDIGELDYRCNLADPHPAIVTTLRTNADTLEMYRDGLPAELAL
jgi:transglutaminase-like putative cysteine protease